MTEQKAGHAQLQAGFALLIVLWTLSLLSLLGTQLVAAGRSDTQLARNLLDGATLEAAAEGAVQQAIFRLLDRPERRWVANGTEHVIRVGQAVVAVRLEDEDGKVNPNIASEPLLQALLVQVGAEPAVAASLAAAIVDWRSASRQPRPRGAKAPQYAAAGLDYGPPGSEFRSIDELGAVLGMTPAVLKRLRPHVTVFSEADPDGATRDPVVAAALLTDMGRVPAAVTAGVQVVSVTALARGAGRSAFAERAIVRINSQTDGHPYELLALERMANPLGFSGN
jgi:general secretion pathway protein K